MARRMTSASISSSGRRWPSGRYRVTPIASPLIAISPCPLDPLPPSAASIAVKSRSEEHTSELQSLMRISYAVFCLKKKTTTKTTDTNTDTQKKSRTTQHNTDRQNHTTPRKQYHHN